MILGRIDRHSEHDPGCPVSVQAYAICIMIGILLTVWLTERRVAPRRFMRSGGLFTEHRPPLR